MTNDIPRYCPERSLPPYSYVPGLPTPHPTRDPRGHSFGRPESRPQPLADSSYADNATYRYAIDLFNHGFYWEAHEEWESLWHAAGRSGTTADFLKGLIKLAAAGVKAREGRAAGVWQHAQRAAQLFRGVAEEVPNHAGVGTATEGTLFGLALDDLFAAASQIAKLSAALAGSGTLDARRGLPIDLRLDRSSSRP